jgi:glycosyltransferase involved in cell wall biosynthesis
MPGVTFYWVGDGPYTEQILSVLGKYENFKWLGVLQYPDKVREYLSEIDVYALISGMDLAPLTLKEAQLMEKPVIATDVGGIPEMMEDHKTGFLVKEGDYHDLIEKISILINDSNKAKEMGVAGRNFVKNNFNWELIAKDFLNMTNSHLNKV